MKALTRGQAPVLRAIHNALGHNREIGDDATYDPRHIPPFVVESFDTGRWSSATFAGFYHRLVLRLDVAEAALPDLRAKFAARLVATRIDPRGQICLTIDVTEAASDPSQSGHVFIIDVDTIDD